MEENEAKRSPDDTGSSEGEGSRSQQQRVAEAPSNPADTRCEERIATRAERGSIESKRRWRLRNRTRIELGLTGVLALATVLNAYFICRQWDAMERTLAKTNELVKSAHIQADAAAVAANAAAKANDLATNALKLSYRARLYFGTVPLQRPEVSGGTLPWKIDYINGGRGPATQIWSFVTFATGDTAPDAIVPRGLAESYTQHAIPIYRPLRPGEKGAVSAEDAPKLPGLPEAILVKHEKLTVQALLYYRDEFGESHESSVCVTYLGATSATFCPKGNYSD